MQNFLRETHAYKTINIDDNQTSQNWTFVTVSIIVSTLFILIIVWLIARKTNCTLTQIIGKRLANRYDLKRVNVKQTPSSGEDVEMAALIEDRSVSNTRKDNKNPSGRRVRIQAPMLRWLGCTGIMNMPKRKSTCSDR